jgi:hypothetical protein
MDYLAVKRTISTNHIHVLHGGNSCMDGISELGKILLIQTSHADSPVYNLPNRFVKSVI